MKMTSGWRWSMDNLRNVYYFIQLIARQILIFLRDFIFYKFAWFVTTEEDCDNANPKIRAVTPQHADTVSDLVVLLAICGLLFAFMILSANSPKNEASNCEMIRQVEAMPMAFEDETTFFCSSLANSQLTRCCDSPVDSRDVVVETREISRPAVSKSNVSTARRPSEHYARSSHPHKCAKTQTNCLVAQTTPRKWLVRRTRSGHIYGKYSV
ncbi:uncharacterized protein LOC116842660 [Odontomachus brunneus]|uniref:uncharacterized protein LOC116842660 n=1 Tax=Odontomachus brunneus TaxID=486640 RepID=UPI0013F2994D|nr:uncharacterized protein LOC116842660 [Odontomachus brunneus]